MPDTTGYIKTLKLGEGSAAKVYELLPKYIQDSTGVAKTWVDIEALAAAAKMKVKVVPQLPSPITADMLGTIYLVPESGTKAGTYVEYIVINNGTDDDPDYAWEKIGTTETDLANYVKKGTYNSESNGGHEHTVTGAVAVPTVTHSDKKLAATASGTTVSTSTSDALVSASVKSTDEVLGVGTSFSADQTVTKKYLGATASGTSVAADGTAAAITALGTPTTADAITGFGTHTTANAITGFGTHTTDSVLGADTTFNVSGGEVSKTYIKATASGTAVSTNDDDFVKSYPGVSGTLSTGTVRGVKGTIEVQGPVSIAANTNTAASWGASVDANGELSFNWTANVPAALSFDDNYVVAQMADSDSSFVTGLVGGGTSVLTGLGTASTAKALTSASVSTQPTIALATDTTSGTGKVQVATDVSAVGVTAAENDRVASITALGTPTTAAAITALGTPTTAKAITGFGAHTTANALTGVKVTAQPTIALAFGSSGTGKVEVVSDASSIEVTAGDNDKVTAVTDIETSGSAFVTGVTVSAQPTITLDGNASTGVAYVAGVTVGTEDSSLKNGAAATAGAHIHAVALTSDPS